jgi:hypothetical protein
MQFVFKLFESLISVGFKTETSIQYLNQISWPSLPCWKLLPSIALVNGENYLKCRNRPDQCLERAPLYKESERGIELANSTFFSVETILPALIF